MTVFKAFLKVLYKNKSLVILYTVILVLFGGFQMKNNDNPTSFVASKPDIYIVNQDEEIGITKSLITYLKKHSDVVSLKEDKVEDALFYREVQYILYIPKNFRNDFLAGKQPQIKVKSTKDYMATLASMQLKRYLMYANLYLKDISDEKSLIAMVEDTLSTSVKTEVTSKLDTEKLSKLGSYYNFMNYSILAGCVYVVCFILTSFQEKKIRRRTMISSMNLSKYQRILLLSNLLFAFTLWGIYILLGFLMLGDVVFSKHGILLIMNSFVFMIFALTLSFFLSNLIRDKNAINGIVNVIALGSSFLCGAFVPLTYLPDFVLKIAHFLPSYYYIYANDLIIGLESFNDMGVVYLNLFIILCFSGLFVLASYLVSYKRRQEI